jgi:hypothetical protein
MNKVIYIIGYLLLGSLFCFCQPQKQHTSDGSGETDEVYLFTSFREPATDGLYLAYSEDGYHWHDLEGPYLAPEVGPSKLMRDPSVVKGPDGRYHMVWTTDWRSGNGFGYANTEDFVTWSEQKFIPVMEHEPEVVNVWAPEIYYDDEDEHFIIIWASTIPHRFEKGEEDEDNNHRMYYVTTKDFETFSDTRLFIDPGFSIIDAVIVERDQQDYVLVLKDNTRPNRNLKVAFGPSPLGPYENISDAFSEFLTEGPTVIEQEGEWLIFFDSYGSKKYDAVSTSDFKEFTPIGDQISFPDGHKHGTITEINTTTLQGIKAQPPLEIKEEKE